MRHGMANKKLNRTSEHRKALLKNMLNSLIKYEQIKTTLPKAKFLKPQADKIITLGKKETLQSTKMLVTKLQDIKLANKVKKTLSKRYEKRKGGYTRIVKAGFRYGDNAPMAIIEFVDRDVEAKKIDKKKKVPAREENNKEEFNPGIGSDPDFNMKLWREGIRIFKGLNNFKVYHFGSITTRKKEKIVQNRGDKTFLKKWGITTKFFKKYYLKSKTKYNGPLNDPKINLEYLLGLVACKIKSFFTI